MAGPIQSRIDAVILKLQEVPEKWADVSGEIASLKQASAEVAVLENKPAEVFNPADVRNWQPVPKPIVFHEGPVDDTETLREPPPEPTLLEPPPESEPEVKETTES